MKQTIILFGDPVLREKARPIEKIDESVRALAQDLLDTMYANEGIGLAAEQIGHTRAMFVIDIKTAKPRADRAPEPEPPIPMPVVMINPCILSSEGELVAQEGCLSFPELYAKIRRAAKVRVTYLDLDGATREAEVEGLLARAVQHELDHLNGVLFVDRMSLAQRVAVAGQLKRIKRGAKPTAC